MSNNSSVKLQVMVMVLGDDRRVIPEEPILPDALDRLLRLDLVVNDAGLVKHDALFTEHPQEIFK